MYENSIWQLKVLTLCMLGNFVCFIFCQLIFFKIILIEKISKAQCQIVWIQIRADILFRLTWIKTIC